MSEARWCDWGAHPFPAGQKGTVMLGKLVETGTSRFGQQPEVSQEVREMCPECAAEVGLNDDYVAPMSPKDRKAALTRAIGEKGQPTE